MQEEFCAANHPRLMSSAEALPQVCKDKKEREICRFPSHLVVTSVLEQHLLALFHPLHLQLLETLPWECHCLGHKEEIGGTNPSPLERKGQRGKV